MVRVDLVRFNMTKVQTIETDLTVSTLLLVPGIATYTFQFPASEELQQQLLDNRILSQYKFTKEI